MPFVPFEIETFKVIVKVMNYDGCSAKTSNNVMPRPCIKLNNLVETLKNGEEFIVEVCCDGHNVSKCHGGHFGHVSFLVTLRGAVYINYRDFESGGLKTSRNYDEISLSDFERKMDGPPFSINVISDNGGKGSVLISIYE